jgi:glycosyltransferase involved in cell wall biosynthesis
MLTVLMSTRNRSRILRDVLESYQQIQQPLSGWKLVVVDNGSTDETAEVLSFFKGHLPLHSVSEPRVGKNYALNTGLEFVEGDLLVLTDDDAFPRHDWLMQLRKAADTQLSYSMFGGLVVPRWQVLPPPWIQWVDINSSFGINSPSLEEGWMPPSLLMEVIGPNMAIRSNIFQSGTRFDTSIGPNGSSYAMGSETELVLRLTRQGHRAWHVHGAVVEHLVREEQLKKRWILQRAIRFGRGMHRLVPNKKLWIGIPRHLFRDLPKEGLLMAAAWVTLRREALFRSHWRFNFLRGQAIEARILFRQHRRGSDQLLGKY